MTRALPRAHFSSSRLVRQLASASSVPSAPSAAPKQDFAERLGQWLRVPDAIELHAALSACATAKAQTTIDVSAIADEVARTRLALAGAIQRSFDMSAGDRRLTFPTTPTNTPAKGGSDTDFSFVPYHRFHLAHQREMELRITPLRARVRDVLRQAGPTLQSLAALDAVFEKSLAVREYNLLATVPTLLEQRFAQLLAAHRQALQDDVTNADAATWLRLFGNEMQHVLLAELDLRFEPINGLLAALQAAAAAEAALPSSPPSPVERGSAAAHPGNRN